MRKRNNFISRQGYLVSVLCLVLLFVFVKHSHASRFAVIVGCNTGNGSTLPLQFAEKDAAELSGILRTLGGFEAGNIRMISGADSLQTALSLASVDSLIKRDTDHNSLFLFYYSGHADAQGMLLGKRRFTFSQFRSVFDSSPAAIKIGVFDACFSGSITAPKGGKSIHPFYFEEQKPIEGQVIIASAAATEFAQESQTLQGSVFSHHFFNALRGSADPTGSSRVTVNQAYQYAYRKTIETTALSSGEAQHPVFKFDIRGQGDIVLTTLAKATSCVQFDRSCEGKFLVLSDDYLEVFADFSKKKGAENRIALMPGQYRIINAIGKDVGMHNFSLHPNETYPMSASRLTPTQTTTARFKGESGNTAGPQDTCGAPLSTHSWGVGANAKVFFKTGAQPSAFPGISLTNAWYINESNDLFLDVHLNFPDINTGCQIGFDHFFDKRRSPFFAGVGIGPGYWENLGGAFRKRVGLTVLTRVGVAVDVNKRMNVRIQIPYQVFVGNEMAQSIGLEVMCMFFGPYRDIRALRL